MAQRHVIKPEAQLPPNYESCEMRLCLTRNGSRWSFCFVSEYGFKVPLRGYPGHLACSWQGFRTRKAAAAFAARSGFPPYAIWNRKKRVYDSWSRLPDESRLLVHARNRGGVSWTGGLAVPTSGRRIVREGE